MCPQRGRAHRCKETTREEAGATGGSRAKAGATRRKLPSPRFLRRPRTSFRTDTRGHHSAKPRVPTRDLPTAQSPPRQEPLPRRSHRTEPPRPESPQPDPHHLEPAQPKKRKRIPKGGERSPKDENSFLPPATPSCPTKSKPPTPYPAQSTTPPRTSAIVHPALPRPTSPLPPKPQPRTFSEN